jgi:hypothetical protein
VRPSLAARWLVFACLALVPLRIVASGYLPDDDVLRHAAKAVSGRAWSEVLVLRPDVTMDSHPGWHALLGAIHRIARASAPDLALLSVLLLLAALLLPAVFLVRRPEAWAIAVAAFATLDPRLFSRFASGRPFVLSAAVLLVLCLLALQGCGEPARTRLLLVAAPLLAIAAWIHPSWHLFLLPVAACLLAGERRLALLLGASLAAGVLIAGLLHGRPLEFVEQSLRHTALAMGSPAPPGTLAIEFLPGDGSPLLLLAVAALVLWRLARGRFDVARVSGPVPLLALLGWLLGWLVIRFWSDWGAVALLAWMAHELASALEELSPEDAPRRVVLAAVCGLAALLACSAPLRGGRAVDRPFLALGSAAAEPALPDPGGVLYTDDMRLFFQLFYSRPQAPFRYIVGYEPALMPPADLATFRRILSARTAESYAPWLAKMTPRDRLILISAEGQPPIPGLEWTQVSRSLWSGRVAAGGPR